VLTGSFNFTHQAEAENAENLLVIKGYPGLVHTYRDDFFKHKEHARAPQAVPAGRSDPSRARPLESHAGHDRRDAGQASHTPAPKAA
jgi:hypothetical protein